MLRKELVTAIIVSILLVSVPSCAKTDSIETEEIESTITNLVRPSESDIKPSEDSHRRVDESTVQSSELEVEETDPYVINGIRIKTEEEIENELVNHPDFFPYQSLTINSLEISRRQTNVDAMTDCVWVVVDAANENLDCELQYELTYNLYNDGWMLDTVTPYERDSWSIVPLQCPTYDEVISIVMEENANSHRVDFEAGNAPVPSYNYTGWDSEFSGDSCVYYLYRTETYEYATVDFTDKIEFVFDPLEVAWTYSEINYGCNFENIVWNIAGNYGPYDPEHYISSIYIVITNDSYDNYSIVCTGDNSPDGRLYFRADVILGRLLRQ